MDNAILLFQIKNMNYFHYYTGRQYDKTGNLNQWWNTSVITRFKERAQCIINQYNEFVVPEAGLNVRIV
jgi:predicted metalloendopeptidase